jgi:hypothetical protein
VGWISRVLFPVPATCSRIGQTRFLKRLQASHNPARLKIFNREKKLSIDEPIVG